MSAGYSLEPGAELSGGLGDSVDLSFEEEVVGDADLQLVRSLRVSASARDCFLMNREYEALSLQLQLRLSEQRVTCGHRSRLCQVEHARQARFEVGHFSADGQTQLLSERVCESGAWPDGLEGQQEEVGPGCGFGEDEGRGSTASLQIDARLLTDLELLEDLGEASLPSAWRRAASAESPAAPAGPAGAARAF